MSEGTKTTEAVVSLCPHGEKRPIDRPVCLREIRRRPYETQEAWVVRFAATTAPGIASLQKVAATMKAALDDGSLVGMLAAGIESRLRTTDADLKAARVELARVEKEIARLMNERDQVFLNLNTLRAAIARPSGRREA